MINTYFRLAAIFLILLAVVANQTTAVIPVTGSIKPPLSHNEINAEIITNNIEQENTDLAPRTVHIKEKFSFTIANQPKKDHTYVTMIPGVVTDFRYAKKHGSVGLLAHNFLAGEEFSNIEIGDRITIRGDEASGNTQEYIVHNVSSYQALDPLNEFSDFKNLENGKIMSASQLARDMYGTADHLTLQTCIEKDGNWVWGRLFIIASPA